MIKSPYINKLIVLFYGIAVFIITRQVPLLEYSFISNISLILIPLLFLFKENYLKNNILKLTLFWTLCLLFMSIALLNNDIKLAFRFTLIIILISTAYFVKIPHICIKILLYFVSLQCIFLIILELILMFNLIDISSSAVRTISLNSGWGDIWSLNNFFYRIQIKGNALIPVTLFITFVTKYFCRASALL